MPDQVGDLHTEICTCGQGYLLSISGIPYENTDTSSFSASC
jgi:hypothetical protein